MVSTRMVAVTLALIGCLACASAASVLSDIDANTKGGAEEPTAVVVSFTSSNTAASVYCVIQLASDMAPTATAVKSGSTVTLSGSTTGSIEFAIADVPTTGASKAYCVTNGVADDVASSPEFSWTEVDTADDDRVSKLTVLGIVAAAVFVVAGFALAWHCRS